METKQPRWIWIYTQEDNEIMLSPTSYASSYEAQCAARNDLYNNTDACDYPPEVSDWREDNTCSVGDFGAYHVVRCPEVSAHEELTNAIDQKKVELAALYVARAKISVLSRNEDLSPEELYEAACDEASDVMSAEDLNALGEYIDPEGT